MLIKQAYSSSCLQVVLVCVHPFCRNSLVCIRKLQKKLKTPIFGTHSPSNIKFRHEILETLDYHMVKNLSLYFTWC